MSEVLDFKPKAVAAPGFFPKLAAQFLAWLQHRNYSPHTVLAYRHDLEQFAGFIAARDIHYAHLVSTALVEDFTSALVQGEGNSARTAARKLETVKRFFAWAVNRQLLSFDPAVKAAPVRWQTGHVLAPDSATLLRVIESIKPRSPEYIRDRALLRLIYDSGLRSAGALGLDVYVAQRPPASTVHPDGRVTYVAKGGRAETAVVDATTLDWLDAWLAVRRRFAHADSPPAIFLTTRGRRMCRVSLWQRVALHGKAAGVDKLSPRLFRHRRAYELLEAAGPRVAQMQLGHRNLSTTLNTYGHEHAERLRAKVRAVPIGGAA